MANPASRIVMILSDSWRMRPEDGLAWSNVMRPVAAKAVIA